MVANEKRVSDGVDCTRSAQGMLTRAGENHIGIPLDRFLHLDGQAEIHMYIYDNMKQLWKSFLLFFKRLGILRTEISSSNCCKGGRWAVVSYYSQGRASV
jgi:hypothetical protein